MATTVLLARHGETTWNRDGRVQGWAPSPLTELGHKQARGLGAHLAATYDVERILASDLRRVRETTAHVVRAVGVEATYERDWRERDFGCMQGLTVEELFGGYPRYSLSEIGYAAAEERPDSGESLLDTRERVLDRFERLRANLGDETTLVVAHGGPIHLLVGHAKGLDVVASFLEGQHGNCALSELAVGSDGSVEVVRENETSFLST